MTAFPATRHSVIERVRSDDAAVRRDAFGDLAEGYWKPSYHYLRLRWQLRPDEAEDVVQAFFATAFEKHYVERFDVTKSRFRTFLRVCLDRYVQNQRKASSAAKRGGDVPARPLDFPAAERELDEMHGVDLSDVDRFFHDETIRFLFARTVATLEVRCSDEGRLAAFLVFKAHDLEPSTDTSYATVARALSLTVSQVTNHLHLARRLFRDIALDHLRALSASEAEYRREARELFGLDVAP